MNFDSFSHGQILSKIWLCEQLEPLIPEDADILILGSWYNVLGFMLKVRNPNKCYTITGIDINPEAIHTADKICNAWINDDYPITNKIQNALDTDYSNYNVVINCSPEHMESTEWFNKISTGTLVCIQSSNVTDSNDPWFITVPSPTLESFNNKFMLAQTFFNDTLEIRYGNNNGYDRYMTIGRK